jgi:hypothetical protein
LDCALLSIRAAFWDLTPIYVSFLEFKARDKMPIWELPAINNTSLHADLTADCFGYQSFLWQQGTPDQHLDATRADVLGHGLLDIAWIPQHKKPKRNLDVNPFLEASCTSRHGKYPFNRLPFLPTAGWVVSDGEWKLYMRGAKPSQSAAPYNCLFRKTPFSLTETHHGVCHFSQFQIACGTSSQELDWRLLWSYMAWSAWAINWPIEVLLRGSNRATPQEREIAGPESSSFI